MKRNWMAFCLAAALMTAGTVYAKPAPSQLVPEKHGQCYVEDNLFVKDVNGAGGGQGVLHGDFAFRREQALKTDAIKEIGWMTLKPGSYIGSHTHKDNEDAYLIISGKGIFTDGNGHAWVVGAGDMTIARPGQTHGLANLGKEDLVFLDIIAKNDSADLSKMAKEGTTQYFPVSAQFEKNVEKAGAGKGTGILFGRFAFRREAATQDQAIKEIGRMTLKKGASIGMHNMWIMMIPTLSYLVKAYSRMERERKRLSVLVPSQLLVPVKATPSETIKMKTSFLLISLLRIRPLRDRRNKKAQITCEETPMAAMGVFLIFWGEKDSLLVQRYLPAFNHPL